MDVQEQRTPACSTTCLAAVGDDLAGCIASARSADKNVVIDGCKIACGKDFGMVKGETTITSDKSEG